MINFAEHCAFVFVHALAACAVGYGCFYSGWRIACARNGCRGRWLKDLAEQRLVAGPRGFGLLFRVVLLSIMVALCVLVPPSLSDPWLETAKWAGAWVAGSAVVAILVTVHFRDRTTQHLRKGDAANRDNAR